MQERIGQGLAFTDEVGVKWSLGRGAGVDALLCRDGQALAGFRFRDELRAESVEEAQALRQKGLQVSILSGDRRQKVEGIAEQLGLAATHWQAEMSPEEKADWVRRHDAEDTLYIGDGANDSLAFDAALCAGSPVTGRSFLEQRRTSFSWGIAFALFVACWTSPDSIGWPRAGCLPFP